MAKILSSHNRGDRSITERVIHDPFRSSSNLGSGFFIDANGKVVPGEDYIPKDVLCLISEQTAEYYSHQKRGVANNRINNKKYAPSTK
jgi:hypothetical protein